MAFCPYVAGVSSLLESPSPITSEVTFSTEQSITGHISGTEFTTFVTKPNDTVEKTTDLLVTESRANDSHSSIINGPNNFSLHAIMWFGLIPVFALIGLVSNLSGMCFLFTGRLFRQPFHILIFALMAVDFAFLVILSMMSSLEILEQFNKELARYFKCYAHRNLQLIQSLTYSSCGHLIMGMAFERAISIKYPLKLKTGGSRKCTVFGIFLILTMNAASLIPGFLLMEPKEIFDPKTNKSICKSVPTEWAKANVAFNQDYALIVLTVFRLIPGLATLAANIYISILTARHRFERAVLFANKTTSVQYFEQFKMTMTLIVLSVALLLSWIPSGVATVLIKYFPDIYGPGGSQHVTYLYLVDVSYVLRVFSAANDFLVYIMMSRYSRMKFIEMVRGKCCCCTNSENVSVFP